MLRILGDRVLVALPPKVETQDAATGFTVQGLEETAGGLFLAKPTEQFDVEIATRGIVVQLGEKRGQVDLDDVRAEVHTWFVETVNSTRSDAAFALSSHLLSTMGDVVDLLLMNMGPAPFDVRVGDCVAFPPSVGEKVLIDGDDIEYLILHESDIIGILEQKEQAA